MVSHPMQDGFVDWDWLNMQRYKTSLNFVRHIHLDAPITIKLDGRKGRALILKPNVDFNTNSSKTI